MSERIKLALADDHILVRSALAKSLTAQHYDVVVEASDGQELIHKLRRDPVEIVLMDVSMPVMDGVKATEWLRKNMPSIKVLALTMFNEEKYIIRMLRAGACGYVLKGGQPHLLNEALINVAANGFHYSDIVTGSLLQTAMRSNNGEQILAEVIQNDREMEFIKLSCTDMSMREIAGKMNVSPRTVENYRDSLFTRLGVKSRVSLVMYAVREKLVEP